MKLFKTMKPLTKFTRRQRIILTALAALTGAVIIIVSCVVANQLLKALASEPASPTAPATAVIRTTEQPQGTPTPVPTLPPTWTPEPTRPVRPIPPYFQTIHCPFERPLGATVECGYLYVAENRAIETSENLNTLRLAVAIYRSRHEEPLADPVVYLHGGPGGGIVENSAYLYEDFISPLLAKRDVILFDQRGSGLSKPTLACPEYSELIKRELRQGYAISDTPAERHIDALVACHERLVRLGIDPAAYTSTNSAADVHDLAVTLGFDQINLYGVSYGTRLALTVMRDTPDIVRSAVLDSAVPVEINIYAEQAYKADYALHKLFAGCAENPDCAAAYPDLEATYDSVVDQLNQNPMDVWGITMENGRTFNASVNGDDFTALIFFSMYAQELVPLVPAMIHSVSLGNRQLLASFMASPLGAEEGITMGSFISINCHEEIFATTPEAINAAYDAYPDMASFARAALFNDVEAHFDLCRAWGAAPFDPREVEPVISDRPSLILAGEYDPATPPDFGRQIDQALLQSYFFEFPGEAHGVGMSDTTCALPIVMAFLDDPTTAPDAACIHTMPTPDFLVP